jgi:hypothetical protein
VGSPRERICPRYFFNVIDGTSLPDRSGTELRDIYTAQDQAVRMAGELLRELRATLWNDGEWELEVTDAHGAILFVLRVLAEESPMNLAPTSAHMP